MNLDLLKTLTQIASVAFDETHMEDFLVDFAKENGLNYQHDKGYGVVIGNPKAPLYCIAHIDEVGGKITHIKENNLKFKGIGRVYPGMFVGKDVEIKTQKGEIIPGIVISKKALTTEYKRFGDLSVYVDEEDFKKINKGDYLRYATKFIERKKSIFANTLDNRVGIFVLLEFILKHKDKKDLLENIAFCFATQEEIKNKGAIYYMKKYMPKDILIFDVIPNSLIEQGYSLDTYIIEKTPDYKLNKEYQKLLSKYNNVAYISSKNKLYKNSEPYKYEKITEGRAMNILCPILNYHNGIYLLEKEAFKLYDKFSEKIILEISKNK